MAASIHYVASETPCNEASLVQFTNGRLRVNSQGQCPEPPQFGCYANTNTQDARKKNQRILAAETSSMEYVGYNYGRNAPRSNSVCKYLVGILDKESGRMQVCDAQCFTMRPKLPGSEDLEQSEKRELSFAEKTDNLTEAFGGAKKKRAMESRIRNKLGEVELDQVMGTAIKLAKHQPAPRSIQTSSESSENSVSFLPPFDKNASKPEEVFKLDDLISASELEMLKQPATVFLEATKEQKEDWKSNSQYPLYILGHLTILPSDRERREQTACCLMYLHYLLVLLHTKAKDLRKKVLFPSDIPQAVKLSILDRFTLTANAPESAGNIFRYIPARMKDKLLSYIIILCLHIDEFELNLNQLLQDLKMPLKRFLGHINTIGCKVKTRKITSMVGSDTERIATLPLPFKLPDKSTRKQKRNRDGL